MPKNRNSYQIGQTQPYKVSRSGIDLFIKCPKCFVLDKREGVKPPSGPGFSLNSAVDALFKIEFDGYRERQQAHPIAVEYGLDLVPFKHPKMDEWRANFTGVQTVHQPTNLLVAGAVDDVWVNPAGTLTVVDYKSTSKAGKLTELGDESWYEAYRRQQSIYVWLLRQNGFDVSDVAYWLYANGLKDQPAFDATLKFDVTLIAYETQTDFIEPKLHEIREALDNPSLPESASDCEMCSFYEERKSID